eukprot:m.154754 g.154754  ORF g.154754 m.154754 type:complete len:1307 (+) comp9794_c1_seq4:88-4008(+)
MAGEVSQQSVESAARQLVHELARRKRLQAIEARLADALRGTALNETQMNQLHQMLAHLDTLEETPLLKRQKAILQRLFDTNARAQGFVLKPAEAAPTKAEEIPASAEYDVLSEQEACEVRGLIHKYRMLARNRPTPLLPAAEVQEPVQDVVEAVETIRNNRIAFRVRELQDLPLWLPPDLLQQAVGELRALSLLQLQRKIRAQMVSQLNPHSALDTAFRRQAFRRPRPLPIREGKKTERLEKMQREELERSQQSLYREHLQRVLQHVSDFKLFHSAVRRECTRRVRAAVSYIANSQRERERLSKERMKRLMAEDETGYRALLDKEKDKRLSYLLDQTDAFMLQMNELILSHQRSEAGPAPAAAKAVTDGAAAAEDSAAGAATEGDKDAEASKPAEAAADKAADAPADAPKPASSYLSAHTIQEKIAQQPDMLVHGKLKEYQIQGLEWLVSLYNNKLNGILADEMGLGKTIQTIALITYLTEVKKNNGPYLIVVPLATLANWTLELERWAPKLSVLVYRGNKANRATLAIALREAKFNVLVTTYEYIIRDKAQLGRIKWVYLIIDEGHRMKNHHCKLTQVLSESFNAPRRLLLSGTPLQNNLPELWALLNFLLPTIFKSSEDFEQWFNAPFAGTAEKVELSEEEKLLVIQRLHKVLRPFLLRRLKRDVETQLPEKMEYVLKCDMSALQRRMYAHMAKHGVLLTDDLNAAKPQKAISMQNIVMQLRKICNHPYIFDNIENGLNTNYQYNLGTVPRPEDLWRASGKMELLDRTLPKLLATGHRTLIFSGSTQLLTMLEDYLIMIEVRYLRMDGGTKAEDRQQQLADFNRPDSPYSVFILSTRAGGLGLNLQTADTVIIYDSDWNPHQDLQAQDRVHRIGQTKEVRVLRFVTTNSIEERVLESAKTKLGMDQKVIQAGMFNKRSTEQESQQYLMRLLQAEVDDGDHEPDALTDEAINEMIARSENEIVQFNRMDVERHKRDKAWQDGVRKARLIQRNELPPWMLEEAQVQEMLEKKESTDGPRARKEIRYADEMTEAQFLKSLEEDDDDPNKKKRRSRARKSVAAADSDREGAGTPVTDSPANGDARPDGKEGAEAKDGAGEARPDGKDGAEAKDGAAEAEGRAKRRRSKLASEAEVVDESRETKRKNKRRRSKKGMTPAEEIVTELLNLSDRNGASLVEMFLQLPDPEEYPDYYAKISNPIDLSSIQEKASSGEYGSLQELSDDISLLVGNARAYNEDGSEIVQDAETLMVRFRDLLAKYTGGKATPAKVSKAAVDGSAAADTEQANGNEQADGRAVSVEDTTATAMEE